MASLKKEIAWDRPGLVRNPQKDAAVKDGQSDNENNLDTVDSVEVGKYKWRKNSNEILIRGREYSRTIKSSIFIL